AFGDLAVHRVEDGFVRSIGRGLDHVPPWSLCLDRTGMYFDATAPSDLEALCLGLDDAEFAARQAEVRRVLALLLDLSVTKYNRPPGDRPAPAHRPGSVLVLGQVEDDQSVRRNRNAVATNEALIARALA